MLGEKWRFVGYYLTHYSIYLILLFIVGMLIAYYSKRMDKHKSRYTLYRLLCYGKIANERTGKPDAFSGLGTILKMIAPFAGSLSKFVISSI